jgi:hypothetical protein
MTREEVISMLSPEAVAIGTRSSGGLEAFLDDVIKHNVTAEELQRWAASGLDRKSDGPEYVCAVITVPLWSCGSFAGYTITPVGEQKFIESDAQYLNDAAEMACATLRLRSSTDWPNDAAGDPQILF